MSRLNTKSPRKPNRVAPARNTAVPLAGHGRNIPTTPEGADASVEVSIEDQLARSVLSTMLWEDSFYESGQSFADRISDLAKRCPPVYTAGLAVRARNEHKLRHAPLLLLDALTYTAQGTSLIRTTTPNVIKRVDELAEMLAVYWRNGRRPIQNNLKKGLRDTFARFDPHQLKKYARRDGQISLRDVMFLVHPKPGEEAQPTFNAIAEKTARVTGTWESSMRAATGGEAGKVSKRTKRDVWEHQLKQNKLGYMALLKNLRNMIENDVDKDLIRNAILERRGAGVVLPFRFWQAYQAAPVFLPELDVALAAGVDDDRLFDEDEKTVVLVDVSGSMNWGNVSKEGTMNRMTAAAVLAVMVPGHRRVFTFSNRIQEVRGARGLSGIAAIVDSQPHGGTQLGASVDWLNQNVEFDRLIVITDEQSSDYVDRPKGLGYMINVAPEKNGVSYEPGWVHIDGFSEQVLKYIGAYETEQVHGRSASSEA